MLQRSAVKARGAIPCVFVLGMGRCRSLRIGRLPMRR